MVDKSQLLRELKDKTESVRSEIVGLLELSDNELKWRKNEKTWNILECIEHLNLYGDFYLPEITRRMDKAKPVNNETHFKSGKLGAYFVKGVGPQSPEKLNKMNTFSDKNPLGEKLDRGTLKKFVSQQDEMLKLLERAENYSLRKIHTSATIKFVKVRLGDTFQVVIQHNLRHLEQVKRILSEQEGLSRKAS